MIKINNYSEQLENVNDFNCKLSIISTATYHSFKLQNINNFSKNCMSTDFPLLTQRKEYIHRIDILKWHFFLQNGSLLSKVTK